jgi:flagellar biosynthesis protein FlhF
MYVRKFEADTIEEALKDIKRELGPDAVILKTLTNKGLKGAFKKKKIEITAAISEKNYVRKAQVDTVLNENQKDEFYNGSASYIANMIDQHDQSKAAAASSKQQGSASMSQKQSGYGSAGLNRTVSTTKGIASTLKEGLDDFLSLGEREDRHSSSNIREFNFDDEVESSRPVQPAQRRQQQQQPASRQQAPQTATPVRESAPVQAAPVNNSHSRNDGEWEKQKNKVEELEKKLFELTRNFERIHKKEPIGVYQLRTTLRSLDINETFIQQLIKKGLFELTDTDVENADVVFEFALREMMNTVSVAMPLFSASENKKSPVITVFLSESSCGQTSMVQKIGMLKQESVIIKNSFATINPAKETKAPFAEKIFGMTVVKTQSIAEIVAECRKAMESGKSVFIDYKCSETETNETKKFIDGLRRAFSKVEVLITLSAIHTELYNRKVLGTYRRLSDGVVVSHVDACLNFGSLFNITQDIKDLPYKFFGTGEVVPGDLEPASAERLLAGIFKLS